MMIVLNYHGVSASQALESHIRARIGAALRPFRDEVRRVDVYLRDLNGPKGGEDKSVRLEARLTHRPTVIMRVERDDFYAAAIVASRLLRRAVRRNLKRRLLLSRARPSVPAPDGLRVE